MTCGLSVGQATQCEAEARCVHLGRVASDHDGRVGHIGKSCCEPIGQAGAALSDHLEAKRHPRARFAVQEQHVTLRPNLVRGCEGVGQARPRQRRRPSAW